MENHASPHRGFSIAGYEDPTAEAYFMFLDDTCVGILITTWHGTELSTTMCTTEIDAISRAYTDETAFAIVGYEDALYMHTDDSIELVFGLEQEIDEATTEEMTRLRQNMRAEKIMLKELQ